MTYSPITHIRALSALVMACAVAVFFAQPAVAQTAKKLKCTACVKSKQIRDNGVKSKDIQDGAVTNADLGKDAVTSRKVRDDSLTALDLSNEAGAAFVGGDQTIGLPKSGTVVRSVTVTAPSSGLVIVNASGFFLFQTSGRDNATCSITTRNTADVSNAIEGGDRQNSVQSMPFAGTRGFNVGAGSNTFNLACVENLGGVQVADTQMTAIFVPSSY